MGVWKPSSEEATLLQTPPMTKLLCKSQNLAATHAKLKLDNGIAVHAEDSKAAVEITAVAMDFVPHLWQDHGGAIEIPEEYWMEVNLVDNWLEHYNRSCPNLQADNDQTVSIVHVVAYVNLSNQGQGGQQSANHWVLFLKLGPQKSVSLYMRLDLHPDPNRGKIEVASKPYHNAQRQIDKMLRKKWLFAKAYVDDAVVFSKALE
ncbi:MAG: hypothetical protein M1815_001391 [Lichina confinis]|nr:MAG: hypothetical protein M1815_001391 [Lichina confinis]